MNEYSFNEKGTKTQETLHVQIIAIDLHNTTQLALRFLG